MTTGCFKQQLTLSAPLVQFRTSQFLQTPEGTI